MSTDVYKFKLTEKNGKNIVFILLRDDLWSEGTPKSGVFAPPGVGSLNPLKTEGASQIGYISDVPANHKAFILKGASWDSEVGDFGDAQLLWKAKGTEAYEWNLIEKYEESSIR